jgi:hypothetical protein
MENKIATGRFAYLLASCHDINNAAFFQYMPDNTFVLNGFNIYIGIELNGKQFVLDTLRSVYSFGDVHSVLNINKSADPAEDIQQIIGIVYQIAKHKGKTGIVVPITLNYGGPINHQCAIIITNKNFMFYEPYGAYKKYGVSYKGVISDTMSKFIPTGKKYEFAFYHDKYMPLQEGLQTKATSQNRIVSKKVKQDILDNYGDLLDEIPEWDIPSEYEELLPNGEPVDGCFFIFSLPNKLRGIPEVYKYFSERCSKICVSITVLELALFLGNDRVKLKSLYKSPHVTRDLLSSLFNHVKNNNRILKDTFINKLNSTLITNLDICAPFKVKDIP